MPSSPRSSRETWLLRTCVYAPCLPEPDKHRRIFGHKCIRRVPRMVVIKTLNKQKAIQYSNRFCLSESVMVSIFSTVGTKGVGSRTRGARSSCPRSHSMGSSTKGFGFYLGSFLVLCWMFWALQTLPFPAVFLCFGACLCAFCESMLASGVK